jgi:hypothetical protein
MHFNDDIEGNSDDLWENTDFTDDKTSCSSDDDSEWDTESNNPTAADAVTNDINDA